MHLLYSSLFEGVKLFIIIGTCSLYWSNYMILMFKFCFPKFWQIGPIYTMILTNFNHLKVVILKTCKAIDFKVIISPFQHLWISSQSILSIFWKKIYLNCQILKLYTIKSFKNLRVISSNHWHVFYLSSLSSQTHTFHLVNNITNRNQPKCNHAICNYMWLVVLCN